jgi:hypothetical protein
MGFLDKIMFWKKEDILKDDFGSLDMKGSNMPGMDMGMPNQDFGAMNPGMPDVHNFRGVGDFQSQQAMNRSIYNQMGNDYMDNPSTPSNPPFSRGVPEQRYNNGSQELDVISAKLDAIRATMDAINQRLANLERVAYAEQQEVKRRGW